LRKKKKQYRNREKDESPPDLFIENNQKQEASPQTATQPTHEKEKIACNWRKTAEVSQFIVALVSIGTFAVIAFSSYNQSVQTRESLDKTDTSNMLTQRSIKLAADNSRIENRAWVGIESPPVTNKHIYISGVFNGYELNVPIKNFGKTPAESLRLGCGVFLYSVQRPQVSFSVPAPMSPNEAFPMSITVHGLSDSTIERINAGKIRAYFYGIITYRDINDGFDTTEFMFLFNSRNPFVFDRIGINRMN
jgi:hypothetical protein